MGWLLKKLKVNDEFWEVIKKNKTQHDWHKQNLFIKVQEGENNLD